MTNLINFTEIRISKPNHGRLVAKLYADIGVVEISEKNGRLTIWYPLGTPVSYREEVRPHVGSAEPIKDSSGRTACFYYSADNLLEIKKGRCYTHIQFPPGSKLEFDTDDVGQALS